MATRLIETIGSNLDIFNRRYAIGLFFPILFELIVLSTILFKKPPFELGEWFYTILIVLFVSIPFALFSEKFVWKLTRTSKFYTNYLEENFEKLFKDRIIEDMGKINEVIEKNILDSLKNNMDLILNRTKAEYYRTYDSGSKRLSDKILQKYEGLFLLGVIFGISSLINSIILFKLSWSGIEFFIFFRDQIVSPDINIISWSLLGIFAILLILMYFFSGAVSYQILSSLSVPFVEDTEYKKLRSTVFNVISHFDAISENNFKKIKFIENNISEYFEEEFKWAIKESTKIQLINEILQDKKYEISIDPIVLEEVSRAIAGKGLKIQKFDDLLLSDIHDELDKIESFRKNIAENSDFTVIYYPLIIKIYELLGLIGRVFSREERMLSGWQVNRKFFELEIINRDDFLILDTFRRFRNKFIHTLEFTITEENNKLIDEAIRILKDIIDTIIVVREHVRVIKDTDDNLMTTKVASHLKRKPNRPKSNRISDSEDDNIEVNEEIWNLSSVNKSQKENLIQAGFDSYDKIVSASIEELSKINGIGMITAEKVITESDSMIQGETR